MANQADVEFLARLVHHGLLSRDAVRQVLAANDAGSGTIDECLVAFGHLSSARLTELRRTGGDVSPEVPGHDVFEKVGFGGTSNVYRAREKASGREVALKVLLPELALDASARERFVAEGKLLVELDHPSIVKGYRVAHFVPRGGGDPVYLVSMELVRGKTLLEHLGAQKTFDEDAALSIIVEIAKGLEFLRLRGVVHRDIKPGNVMIGANHEVKLIDLGFAHQSGAAHDQPASDTTVGTIHYLSPEQARGESDLDVRSDIYSLGVTLFQLTVGDLPFHGDAPSEVLRQHVMEGLSSPALKGRAFSPHLHYFIEKMMAKEREIRYADPPALIADIERTIAGKKSLEFRRKR